MAIVVTMAMALVLIAIVTPVLLPVALAALRPMAVVMAIARRPSALRPRPSLPSAALARFGSLLLDGPAMLRMFDRCGHSRRPHPCAPCNQCTGGGSPSPLWLSTRRTPPLRCLFRVGSSILIANSRLWWRPLGRLAAVSGHPRPPLQLIASQPLQDRLVVSQSGFRRFGSNFGGGRSARRLCVGRFDLRTRLGASTLQSCPRTSCTGSPCC